MMPSIQQQNGNHSKEHRRRVQARRNDCHKQRDALAASLPEWQEQLPSIPRSSGVPWRRRYQSFTNKSDHIVHVFQVQRTKGLQQCPVSYSFADRSVSSSANGDTCPQTDLSEKHTQVAALIVFHVSFHFTEIWRRSKRNRLNSVLTRSSVCFVVSSGIYHTKELSCYKKDAAKRWLL